MLLLFYLHPTMYLLIPNSTAFIQDCVVFTSHYVSINSYSHVIKSPLYNNLHPTMYLLIHNLTSAQMI